MRRRAATGEWGIVHSEASESKASFQDLPLGVIEGAEYSQFVIKIEPGDVVVFFTDALTETVDASDGRMLGEQGLLELVGTFDEHDSATVASRLTSHLDELRGGASDDDVTIMTLHHNGASVRKMSRGEKAKMMGLVKV